MYYRRLNISDISSINEIQKEQNYPEIFELKDYWILYGCFIDNELIAMCGLYPYQRLATKDYPTGMVAELGSLFTKVKHRRQGIMTNLIEELLSYISTKEDLDAIVVDSRESSVRLLKSLGFKDSVMGETRLWKQLNR